MAGKETSGIEAADSDLFNGCTYCLTVGKRATKEARDKVAWLVRQMGATPSLLTLQSTTPWLPASVTFP